MAGRARWWRIACACIFASPAQAASLHATSETTLQSSSASGPWGQEISRRRFTQSLFVVPRGDMGAVGFSVVGLARFETDFGVNSALPDSARGGETNPDVAGGAFYVPGLQPSQFELLWLYARLTDFWVDGTECRIGRQPLIDLLGYDALDGTRWVLPLPVPATLEGYVGLKPRDGRWLSLGRYERQGLWWDRQARGGHRDLVEPRPAWVAGGAIAASGPSWLRAQVLFRHAAELGGTTIDDPLTRETLATLSDSRVAEQRGAALLGARSASVGSVTVDGVYDFFAQKAERLRVLIESRDLPGRHRAGVLAERIEPTFAADSIWNWFSQKSRTATELFAVIRLPRDTTVEPHAGMTLEDGDGTEVGWDSRLYTQTPIAGGRLDLQAWARGIREISSWTIDVGAERSLLGDTWDVAVRAHVMRADDNLVGIASSSKLSAGYLLATGFYPVPTTRVGVAWEHDGSDVAGTRFQLLGTLRVDIDP